jgi:hypothetical protein
MFYGVLYSGDLNYIKTQPYIDDAIAELVDEIGDLKEDTITTSAGKTITFSGNGVIVIFVPKSLGALTAIRDAANVNIIASVFERSEVIIDGTNFYLYNSLNNTNQSGITNTLVY